METELPLPLGGGPDTNPRLAEPARYLGSTHHTKARRKSLVEFFPQGQKGRNANQKYLPHCRRLHCKVPEEPATTLPSAYQCFRSLRDSPSMIWTMVRNLVEFRPWSAGSLRQMPHRPTAGWRYTWNSRFTLADFSATERASCSLYSASFLARSGSLAAMISTAKIAALMAPGLPMAVQATGTPAGI